MNASDFISLAKEKYPRLQRYEDPERIYDAGMRWEKMNNASYLHEVEPYQQLEEVQEAAGGAWWKSMASWGIPDWGGNIGKDAYNNSVLGLSELATTGKLPYELTKTLDPETGQMVDVPLNMLESAASFALSMLMPADLLTFALGGKVFSMGANLGYKMTGKGIQQGIKKNLKTGYLKQYSTRKMAEEEAEKMSWKILQNPNRLITATADKPLTHKFINRKTGETFHKAIFNGKEMGEAWFRNANHLGGSLFAHRVLAETTGIMYQNGIEAQKETGEDWRASNYLPSPEQIGKTIIPNALRSYGAGVLVGGVKAISGLPHFKQFDNKLVKAGEYVAESTVFGAFEPITHGKLPTGEEMAHSFLNLAAIKGVHAGLSKSMKTITDWSEASKRRSISLQDEITKLEDISKNTDNNTLKSTLVDEIDSKKVFAKLESEIPKDYESQMKTLTEWEAYLEKLGAKTEKDKFKHPAEIALSSIGNEISKERLTDLSLVAEDLIPKIEKAWYNEISQEGLNLPMPKRLLELGELKDNIKSFIKYYEDNNLVSETIKKHQLNLDTGEQLVSRAIRKGVSISELGPFVEHLVETEGKHKGKELYRNKKTGKKTTSSKGADPILVPRDENSTAGIRQIVKDINKETGERDVTDYIEDKGGTDYYKYNESEHVRIPYEYSGWKSPLSGENKNILASVINDNIVAFSEKIGAKKLDQYISKIKNFSIYLENKHGINLGGEGKTRGEMNNLVEKYYVEGKNWDGKKGVEFSANTKNEIANALRKLYGDKENDRLEKYIPGIGSVVSGTRRKKGTQRQTNVFFLDQDESIASITKYLTNKTRINNFSPGISEKYGIKNREWDLFHRLVDATKGRTKEVIEEITPKDITDGVLSFIAGKTEAKTGKRNVTDLRKEYPKLWEDLQIWMATLESKDSNLFPGILKLKKANKLKQGVVESIINAPKESMFYVSFEGKAAPGEMSAGVPIRATEAIAQGKWKVASLYRRYKHGLDVAKQKKDRGQSGYGTEQWYQQLAKKQKQALIRTATSKAESRFLEKEKSKGLTKEGFEQVKKFLLKRNPEVEFKETKLPKGVAAFTEFKFTSDLINYQLGRTRLKDIWHENIERIYEYAYRTKNKDLMNMFERGIKLIKPQARIEWKAKGGAKGTGYKNFDLFAKEWFVEKVGRVSTKMFVDSDTHGKVSNWMLKETKELNKWWLGVDSDNFVLQDYIMLLGRGGYEGISTLENLGYRNKDGNVVYSKFNSNKKQDVIESARKVILNKLEKKAKEINSTPKELFDTLNWGERFNIAKIKSFGDIKNKDVASALLQDMELNLNFKKIKNDNLKEAHIEFSQQHHEGRISKRDWSSKDILGLPKSGEFQKWIYRPGVIFRKFLGEQGLKLERILDSIVLRMDLNNGKTAMYMRKLELLVKENREGIAKYKPKNIRGLLDLISVYEGIDAKKGDIVAVKTNLSPKQKEFASKYNKTKAAVLAAKKKNKTFTLNPKKHLEYMLVQETKRFYKDGWTNLIKTIENSKHLTKIDKENLIKKLKKKEVSNYLTHTLSKEAREYLTKTNAGGKYLEDVAKRKLEAEFADKDKGDKQFRALHIEKLNSKKLGYSKEQIKELNEKLSKRFQFLIKGDKVNKMRRQLQNELEYNPEVVLNPNVELKRHVYDEFLKVKGVDNQSKFGKKIRTFSTSHDDTVIAWGKRMASFQAGLEHAPELVKFSKKLVGTPIKDLINDGISHLSTKEQRSLKDYVELVFDLQLGIKRVTPEGLFGRFMMQVSRFSAAAGLSSPFSGVKNVILGEAGIHTVFGSKNALEAWRLQNTTEYNFLTDLVAGNITSQRLRETGLMRMPGAKSIFGTKVEFSPSELVSRFGGMRPTEWANRKRAVIASILFVEDGFKALKGEKTGFFKKGISETFTDKVIREYKFNKEEFAVTSEYGLKKENILPSIENYKKIVKIQENARLKAAYYGHKITQGATGVTDLPLWMNNNMIGKWSTVFQRIAYNMTTNYSRNVIEPLKHGNLLPAVRYSFSHILGGYALMQLKDFILGQGNPYEGFDSDEDPSVLLAQIKEYGFAAEFGAGLSMLFNPYARSGDLAGALGIVNIRNINSVAGNVLAFANKTKFAGQSIEDTLKDIFVSYNHGQRIFYKLTSPHLINHRKVRNKVANWAKDNEKEVYFGGAGFSLSENSPYYRKIRHAFMIDRAEGENGYLAAYWSAFDTIVSRYIMQGHSREYANKQAKSSLAAHVNSYNPLKYSYSSEKGAVYIRDFKKSLTKEDAYLVRKTENEYNKRLKTFWIKVNAFNKNERFTKY